MKKVIITSAMALLMAFSSQAKMIIETCVEEHIENTNCFKVRILLIREDPELGRVLISEGTAWVGSDCQENGHHGVPNENPECPVIDIGEGVLIHTLNGKPHCMEESLSSEEDRLAVLASINDLLKSTGQAARKGAATAPATTAACRIFPNPATSHITVATSFKTDIHDGTFHIVDVNGKEVFSTHIQNVDAARFTLSLKDITPGVYNIVIKNSRKVLSSQKLTIQ